MAGRHTVRKLKVKGRGRKPITARTLKRYRSAKASERQYR